MLKKRLKIAVLFGGKSAEHEVSLQSARNVINALDKKKYQVIPVKIGKNGLFSLDAIKKFDVVFPVLHGPYGEDGSMQGVLKLAGVPFVGPSVLGSSIGMDKDVTKRLLKEAGVPIGKFITLRVGESVPFKQIVKTLGLPIFVKPANMGSSVGVYKVKNDNEFKKAIKNAFDYDSKVVLEEMIHGREIECSVLGNEHPIASILGEIIPTKDFYSYEAKYIDTEGARLEIPAKLSKETIKNIQDMAIKVFQVLNCEGMGRVDFFLKANGVVLVNEINTIPGFTSISMYPKLWEASGTSLPALLDKLIDFAIKRHKREQKLKNTVK